jgi:hypothetical protein
MPTASESMRPRNLGHFVLWALSVPERIVRSVAGLVGLLGIGGARLLPRPVRETKFYRTLVTRYLRLLSDDIGGAGRFPKNQAMDLQTATRLGVGGALDNLCLLTLHASPLWILFAAQDLAKGARSLVSEIVDDLKSRGLVQEGSRLDNVDVLLEAVAKLSERTGDVIDMPPLKPTEIKQALEDIRKDLASTGTTALVDVAQLDKFAEDVKALAVQTSQKPLDVLTGIATQAAAKGGKLVLGTGQAIATSIRMLGEQAENVIADYGKLLHEMATKGFWLSIAQSLASQLRVTQNHFVPERVTLTEIGLTFGKLKNASWRLR